MYRAVSNSQPEQAIILIVFVESQLTVFHVIENNYCIFAVLAIAVSKKNEVGSA